MPSVTRRPPHRQASLSIHTGADLLARQWTHGIELRLRLAPEDGCTDLADEVRSVVGEWQRATDAVGPPALVTVRLWLRERLAAATGGRAVLHTQTADELLCAVLSDERSGLVVVPLRKRQCA